MLASRRSFHEASGGALTNMRTKLPCKTGVNGARMRQLSSMESSVTFKPYRELGINMAYRRSRTGVYRVRLVSVFGLQQSFVRVPSKGRDADLSPLAPFWQPDEAQGILSPPWFAWLQQTLESAELKVAARHCRSQLAQAASRAASICAAEPSPDRASPVLLHRDGT